MRVMPAKFVTGAVAVRTDSIAQSDDLRDKLLSRHFLQIRVHGLSDCCIAAHQMRVRSGAGFDYVGVFDLRVPTAALRHANYALQLQLVERAHVVGTRKMLSWPEQAVRLIFRPSR